MKKMDEISHTSGLTGQPEGSEERLDIKPLKTHFEEYKMLDGTKRVCLQRVSSGSVIKGFEHTPYPEKGSDVIGPCFKEL